jgi:uncharacterized protein YutE (UPF0331/DUF86 family)
MDKFPEKIEAEKQNVEKALSDLMMVCSRENKDIVDLAAMAAFLHNIYNGIENILKQLLKSKGFKVPKTDTWHKDLLELSVSEGIISEQVADQLYEYLTFRHFFVHSYGFMLEEANLKLLTDNIPDVWNQFLSAIKKLS